MKRQAGFTLIELMIAIAVVGILTAVAVPNYSRYILRTKLGDAFAGLAGAQPLAEQYWSNKKSYKGMGDPAEHALPANTPNFTFAASNDDTSTYTITATGIGAAAGFEFSIDQSGTRKTVKAPAGWVKKDTCWVNDKSGKCSS